jgi:hypothetical protein
MESFGKKLALVLGVAAGAAIAVFASSKSGRKEIKRISSKTLDLTDNLLDSINGDLIRMKKAAKELT